MSNVGAPFSYAIRRRRQAVKSYSEREVKVWARRHAKPHRFVLDILPHGAYLPLYHYIFKPGSKFLCVRESLALYCCTTIPINILQFPFCHGLCPCEFSSTAFFRMHDNECFFLFLFQDRITLLRQIICLVSKMFCWAITIATTTVITNTKRSWVKTTEVDSLKSLSSTAWPTIRANSLEATKASKITTRRRPRQSRAVTSKDERYA